MSDDDSYSSTRKHYWTRKAGQVTCLACAMRLQYPGAKEGCPLWTTPESREESRKAGERKLSESEARELMRVLAMESDGPTYTCEPSYDIRIGRRG